VPGPTSDGFGSKIFNPGLVGSIFCGSGQVGSGQPFMVWVWIWKISPRNVKFFIFFPSGQKKSLWVGLESTRVKAGLASYLLRVKSKIGSGPISRPEPSSSKKFSQTHIYIDWYWCSKKLWCCLFKFIIGKIPCLRPLKYQFWFHWFSFSLFNTFLWNAAQWNRSSSL